MRNIVGGTPMEAYCNAALDNEEAYTSCMRSLSYLMAQTQIHDSKNNINVPWSAVSYLRYVGNGCFDYIYSGNKVGSSC
ncbi:MAG: hypothetical protein QM654_07300 [Dysgonamonadaceae bacterium]